MPATTECRCFIYHVSPEEREQMVERLHYFRSIGDTNGTMLAMAQLQRCPRRDSPEPESSPQD